MREKRLETASLRPASIIRSSLTEQAFVPSSARPERVDRDEDETGARSDEHRCDGEVRRKPVGRADSGRDEECKCAENDRSDGHVHPGRIPVSTAVRGGCDPKADQTGDEEGGDEDDPKHGLSVTATRLPVRSSPASAELEEERCASRDAIAPHGLSNETRLFDPHPLGVEGLSRSTDDVPAG